MERQVPGEVGDQRRGGGSLIRGRTPIQFTAWLLGVLCIGYVVWHLQGFIGVVVCIVAGILIGITLEYLYGGKAVTLSTRATTRHLIDRGRENGRGSLRALFAPA